jgi:hypothetical protein
MDSKESQHEVVTPREPAQPGYIWHSYQARISSPKNKTERDALLSQGAVQHSPGEWYGPVQWEHVVDREAAQR